MAHFGDMNLKSLYEYVNYMRVIQEENDMKLVFCKGLLRARAKRRCEHCPFVRPSVPPSVSCLPYPAYRIVCELSTCIMLFPVLLKGEKGIAMHSLCKTSCPSRTVHCSLYCHLVYLFSFLIRFTLMMRKLQMICQFHYSL